MNETEQLSQVSISKSLIDVAIQATSGAKVLMFKQLLHEAGYMDNEYQGPMKHVTESGVTWTLYLNNVDYYHGEWMFLEAQKILLIKHWFLLARRKQNGVQ